MNNKLFKRRNHYSQSSLNFGLGEVKQVRVSFLQLKFRYDEKIISPFVLGSSSYLYSCPYTSELSQPIIYTRTTKEQLSSFFSKPCCFYHFYLSSLRCCDPGFQKRERCCSDVARGTELPYMLLLFSSPDPSQSFSNQMRTGWLLWPVGKTAPLSWLKSLVGLLFKSCLGEKKSLASRASLI